ncbi:hypothetical protein ERO13_D13G044800v2 [Gossypium hirsutum]|uniref:Sulfhydryl oxidase n=4 Tax=Gossypium TaxID=3633 RepID=A0A1U8N488_GOSHI|nr:FAD-linked sulfhydryl oxidase ERV1-like isoform X2 [Gossypium hirsutum]KAB1993700.1 hypothetical protein ES319_D13G049500v1 [Gossypium barbadense]KAG4110366.1 hypothetical protein ERO13_D13G044800v2 [Gossypium hirsutum]TYG36269.1 hypothetical protein ES288_D13G051500v1 [Gossypium darwinii]TYI45623.1 hypothetical protein E1A91_D13G050700v1 [Gossypium mustelinum]
MTENPNPFQPLFQTVESFYIANFVRKVSHSSPTEKPPLTFPPPSKLNAGSPVTTTHLLVKKPVAPVTKEELGRATWTFLHTLAAQYPERPTRQQKKDVKQLMSILSRMYPCNECADHFKEVLRANPVQAGSHEEFSQWLCHVHNVINRSLGKVAFPCERVDARWGKLECEQRACDLQGTTMNHTEF